MKNYRITFGTGTAWTKNRIIEVEDWETESEAIVKFV